MAKFPRNRQKDCCGPIQGSGWKISTHETRQRHVSHWHWATNENPSFHLRSSIFVCYFMFIVSWSTSISNLFYLITCPHAQKANLCLCIKWSVQSGDNEKASCWWVMRFRCNKTRCGRNFSATGNDIVHNSIFSVCLSLKQAISNLINIIAISYKNLLVKTLSYSPIPISIKGLMLKQNGHLFFWGGCFFHGYQVISLLMITM